MLQNKPLLATAFSRARTATLALKMNDGETMNDNGTIKILMDAAREVGYGRIPRYQELKSYTVGAFDLILPTSSDPAYNFAILTQVCQKYDEVKGDQKFLDGYIYLLSQLVRCTDTTEIPPGMARILQNHPEKTKELREWYRI